MPTCYECKDDVDNDEVVKMKLHGRSRKLCEDCADRIREEQDIAEESEAVIQGMMEYKGR